jgi:mono/diheme cytochrome c family protein
MIAGFRQPLLVALLLSILSANGAQGQAPAAQRPDHPIVPGFERFRDTADPARGGQLLLGELNCVSCHQPAGTAGDRKQAPILDGVAGRARLSHLRKFLRDPQAVKPGTTMPNLFAGDPNAEQKVEALVHFLATTGALKHERPDAKAVSSGRDLYGKVGCVACHGTRDPGGAEQTILPISVPLGDLKAKYTIATLTAFLESPHKVRPSGRMPKLLNQKEARDVANYLLQGLKVIPPSGKGTTTFAYYEGSWDRVPDFDKLKPSASGTGIAFDLHPARRGDNFAFKFEGFFKLDREGDYTFTLHSDDGSWLHVDGKLVVNNDGVHAPASKDGKVKLARGVHRVTVGFFQGGGGAELDVQVEGAGFGHHPLAAIVAATEAALEKQPVVKKPDDEDLLDVQPELAARGRVLFASAGCAACHALSEGKKPIPSTLKVADLANLNPQGGCLAASPARGAPRYSLSAAQRQALTAALRKPVPPARTPAEVIAQTLTTFNCYACHVRDKIGGPIEDLNKSFQTTQPEMGDEGRVPPLLDGVGAKLTLDALKQLLDGGAHERPYMHTRMPGFGLANVGPLVEALTSVDTLPSATAVTFTEPVNKVKATARHLIGANAFGCIKCHTFAGHKAEGVQGIDMITMTRRLRHDWFHAYVNDPQRMRPGTRMPAAFLQGKSVLPNILDGTAATQIEAMWLYLQDGNKAQLPVGLHKQSIPLEPTTSAILYRNFIEGAGTRAIGVGYPEKANLAFDANELRLALVWQGAFIDAARHWTDRGAGTEGPLGDNILRLHRGVPFAALSQPEELWPAAPAKAQGYRFLGYRLSSDDRPTFLYALGDVKVEDFPSPVAGKEVSLRRMLRLTAAAPVQGLNFRAAVGSKIEPLADGWYRVDGAWKLRLEGSGPARARQSGGKSELLLPVRFTGGKAEIVQEIAW